MKKFMCLLLIMLLVLPSVALAAGDLKVTSKNLLEFDGEYTSDTAYFYAKVENVGDAPIAVGYGKLVAFDDDDEILFSEEYIASHPADILLQPGEYVYMSEYIWENVLESTNVADYKFSASEEKYPVQYIQIPCEATFELHATGDDNYLYVTFTNSTEDMLQNLYASVALLDDAGTLLFATGSELKDISVHSGSTITVRFEVESKFVEYYTKNNLEPTTIDALMFYKAN